jgi:SAM-dependent methyltransferase
VDVCTMIFVLSAIHPDKMLRALQHVHRCLRPGGRILFRDYGVYDMAQVKRTWGVGVASRDCATQVRFKKGHKISDNFYVRHDGTRAYYFSEEKLQELAEAAGFDVVTCVMQVSWLWCGILAAGDTCDICRAAARDREQEGGQAHVPQVILLNAVTRPAAPRSSTILAKRHLTFRPQVGSSAV